jgi:hypothetical protein
MIEGGAEWHEAEIANDASGKFDVRFKGPPVRSGQCAGGASKTGVRSICLAIEIADTAHPL